MSNSHDSYESDNESIETVDVESSRSSNNDSTKSTDSDDMRLVVAQAGAWYAETYLSKQPYRDDSLTGVEYVMRVVTRNGNRCIDMLRMEPHVFGNMCTILRGKTLLKNSKHVSVEEQVAIFLMTMGHGHKNRIVAYRFQHSGEIISKYMGRVLYALCKWGKEIIVAPNLNVTPPQILHNEKYMPWFENCASAIDGTHISACMPLKDQVSYRGRKMTLTQNVMATCSFDMRFTFIYAGWEGTANDSRVLMTALTDPSLGFPHPPIGKYYLVDAGYPNIPGYLAPHRQERYHRSDFRGGRRLRRSNEFFNQRHSSLRNVIERCFGVLKNIFPILKMMSPYSVRKQAYIVGACCTIHNFLRMEKELDEIGSPFEDEDVELEEHAEGHVTQTQELDASPQARREMNLLRNDITLRLAEHYNIPS